MNRQFKTLHIVLAVLVILLFGGMTSIQNSILSMRTRHNLIQTSPFESMEPGEFAGTVLLGGFRGLAVDFLWMKYIVLQEKGKYFELPALAEWITNLQPRFEEIWVYNGWNMAYNIAHGVDGLEEKWIWVKKALEFEKEGLRRNPNSYKILHELGKTLSHKFDRRFFPREYKHFRTWYESEFHNLPQLDAIRYYRQMMDKIPLDLTTRMTKLHLIPHVYYQLGKDYEYENQPKKYRFYLGKSIDEWKATLDQYPFDPVAKDWIQTIEDELSGKNVTPGDRKENKGPAEKERRSG